MARKGQPSRHWRKICGVGAPVIEKMCNFCSGRIPVYVHPSFYGALKVRLPINVGGLSRDGQVTTTISTGSLVYAVGILTPDEFKTLVNTELEGK